jgi:hypothetical protein
MRPSCFVQDIKSDNVLLTTTMRNGFEEVVVKLIDFGCAKKQLIDFGCAKKPGMHDDGAVRHVPKQQSAV